MDDRLPTETWVSAHLRLADSRGVPAHVVNKGAATGGTVMVKVYQRGMPTRVMTQVRDLDGRLAWMTRDYVTEGEADEALRRSIGRDPDLWVIEIESPDGWQPFEGPVLS